VRYLPPFNQLKELLHFTGVAGVGVEANPPVTCEQCIDALRALLSVVDVSTS